MSTGSSHVDPSLGCAPTATTPIRPLRMAMAISLVYLAICAVYIAISSNMAADTAASVEELRSIETLKGLLFVLVTSAVFFWVVYIFCRRIYRQSRLILRQAHDLVSSERLVMAGTLTASFTHDLSNYVSSVVGNATLIRDATDEPDVRESADQILAAGRIMADTIRRINMSVELHVPGEAVAIDAGAVTRRVLDSARRHASLERRDLRFEPAGDLTCRLNVDLYARAVFNVIINAAEATADGGVVQVELKDRDDHMVVEVHDDGPGVPEDMRERIFEVFHSTKPDGHGLGLLSLKLCAEYHEGRIDVQPSDLLGGACFSLWIPMSREAGEESSGPSI